MTAVLLVAAVTAFAVLLPGLARPTLPFGVRITHDRVADPAVIHQKAIYLRLLLVAALLAAAGVVLIGGGLVWPSVLAAADFAIYLRAHHAVRRAKRKWGPGKREGVTVDTSFRTDPVRLPWPHLVPAAVVVAATVVAGLVRYGSLPADLVRFTGFGVDPDGTEPVTLARAFEPVLIQLGVVVLVPVVALVVLRARPDLDAARPRGSARRYRVYLRGVATMTFWLAGALTLGLAVSASQVWHLLPANTGWRVATYVPLAAMVVVLVVWDRRVGSAGHRLPPEPGEEDEESPVVQRDDDVHWYLGGLVYVNRQDPAAFVHARIGHSWTMNLANPVTWLVLAAVLLLLAAALTGVVPERESLF
jgi:uncharacterized membrane protein